MENEDPVNRGLWGTGRRVGQTEEQQAQRLHLNQQSSRARARSGVAVGIENDGGDQQAHSGIGPLQTLLNRDPGIRIRAQRFPIRQVVLEFTFADSGKLACQFTLELARAVGAQLIEFADQLNTEHERPAS